MPPCLYNQPHSEVELSPQAAPVSSSELGNVAQWEQEEGDSWPWRSTRKQGQCMNNFTLEQNLSASISTATGALAPFSISTAINTTMYFPMDPSQSCLFLGMRRRTKDSGETHPSSEPGNQAPLSSLPISPCASKPLSPMMPWRQCLFLWPFAPGLR